MTIIVREATKNDVSTIMEMLIGIAEYTKVSPGPRFSLEDLCRDGGFDDNNKIAPLYIAFLAEDSTGSDNGSSIVIGLAMCSFSYTLEGKALLLNDLFVSPSYRSRGIGKLLFNTVLQYAKKTDRKSVDLYVVKWNPARKLYENLGAIDLNSKEDAQLLRVYDKIIQA